MRKLRKRRTSFLLIAVFLISIINTAYAAPIINNSPPATSDDINFYAIQIGVYASENMAGTVMDRLEKEGFTPGLLKANMYIVYSGIYRAEEDAIKDLDKAKSFENTAYITQLSQTQIESIIISKALENPETNTENVLEAIVDETEKQVTILKKDNGSLEYTYRVINDIELRGVIGESKWYFHVDKDLEVRDFKFNLFYRLSEIIMHEFSYITIYMNDIPIHSMKLKEKDTDVLKNWFIDIPKDKIKSGYNELKIRTNTRISELPCESDKITANWLVIDGKTNYVVSYNQKSIYNKISDFPKFFTSMRADNSHPIGIIIPDDYKNYELSAALTMIARLKSMQEGYNYEIDLLRSSDFQMDKFEGFIYLGSLKKAPKELQNLALHNSKNLENNGDRCEIIKTNSENPLLMLVSEKEDALLQGVKALFNGSLREQMDANYYSVESSLDTRIKEKGDNDLIYLSDLGINGIHLEGIEKQVTNIGMRIPYNKKLARGSYVHLNTRYSDNLDYEKSMVSIYINGVAIGSEKLLKDKRDSHEVKVYIPENLVKGNYYDIQVVFELIPDGILTCERYLHSVPWAYIVEDSSIYMTKQERGLALFQNLPHPFTRDNDIDITTIILPNKPQKEDLAIAGKIASVLGADLVDNEGIVKGIKADEFGKQYYGDNLVVFGTPKENKIIEDINDYLWFKYNDNFTTVLSNEKIELLSEIAETSTYIELKPSPFDKDKGILTLTSLAKESLFNAIKYFDDDKIGYLTGDASLVKKSGEILNFRFQKEEERPFVSESIIKNKDTKDFLIFAGSFILLMVIALSMFFYKNRKRR